MKLILFVLIVFAIDSDRIACQMDILKIRKTKPVEVPPPPPIVVPDMSTWFNQTSTPARRPKFIDLTTPMAPGNLHIVITPPSGDIYIPPASSIASRQSGASPLAVFFDATGVTSTNTVYPFNECYFYWDFGDGSSGVWSTNGKSKNIATGGVAAHVYENEGNYTTRLTVIDPNGNTNYRDIPITVTSSDVQWAGTKTICFSNTNDFTDAPAGSLRIYTSSWAVVASYVAPDRRLLFRRGETWDMGYIRLTISHTGPGMIGVFGPGSAKVTLSKVPMYSAITIAGASDWRICDISITGSRTDIQHDDDNALHLLYANNRDILFLRIEDISSATSRTIHAVAGPVPMVGIHEKIFTVDCNFKYGSAQQILMTGRWFAFLGTEVAYNLGSVVRICWTNYCTIQACNWHEPNWTPRWNGCGILKLHDDFSFTDTTSTRWVNISDSNFKEVDYMDSGAWGCLLLEPQNTNHPSFYGKVWPETCEHIEDVVIERNLIGSIIIGISINGVFRGTVRNNVFYQVPNAYSNFNPIRVHSFQWTTQWPSNNIWVYNNTAYSKIPTDAWSDAFRFMYSDGSPTNLVARNNFASCPNMDGYMFTGPGEFVPSPELWTQSNNELTDTPGFIDENNNNFHLAAGSPAIDTGYNLTNNYDDKDGTRRTGTFEKGAYQY